MWKKKAIGCIATSLMLCFSLSGYSSVYSERCKKPSGEVIDANTFILCLETDYIIAAIDSSETDEARRKSRPNFRTPPRSYQKVNSDWNIYAESYLLEYRPELARKSLEKLNKILKDLFIVLPKYPASRLRDISFYLMSGRESPHGGRKSGMSYIRNGEPLNYPDLDPRWNNVVVIYSANNFMYLTELWAKKALMHELAHAWHISNWPESHPPIVDAYENAKKLGLYRNVQGNKGEIIAEAYAIKNPLEYFAEISAIYFSGGNYFPFERYALSKYDHLGFDMVRFLWFL